MTSSARTTAAPWIRFLARRLAGVAAGVIFLVIVSFAMIHAVGGDPVRASLGFDAEPALVEQRRAELHLDRSIPVQFGYYVSDLAHLNFGESIRTGEPVGQVIRDRLPNTAQLAGIAIMIALVLGIPLGLLMGGVTSAGRRRGVELGFVFSMGTITAIPEFLMGTLLVFVFALTLGVLPASGKEGWDSLVLPALALALAPACFLARVTRVETVSVLEREYMSTARSKQLPIRSLYLRHALPNVLTGTLTIAGIVFAALLGGSIIIEKIFAWPGIGTTVVEAIVNRDYPTVQACVLVLGVLVLVVNTLIDILLVVLNPRLATLRES